MLILGRRGILLRDKGTDCSQITQDQRGISSQTLDVGYVADRPIPPGGDLVMKTN